VFGCVEENCFKHAFVFPVSKVSSVYVLTPENFVGGFCDIIVLYCVGLNFGNT